MSTPQSRGKDVYLRYDPTPVGPIERPAQTHYIGWVPGSPTLRVEADLTPGELRDLAAYFDGEFEKHGVPA